MMSRKDYEAVAAILRKRHATKLDRERVAEAIAYDLADMFAADDPRFDYDRFMNAAGPEVTA